MTALQQYQRIEATGLWRATPQDQRREVIVSIGDATLVISDLQDRALAHWSLPAVARANPGEHPAIFYPDGDPGETLELTEAEAQMIGAIEKLRSAIERRRPRPGRLRAVILAASAASVLALGVFWLPGAMQEHALSVVPLVKRVEIGQQLMTHVQRVTGQPCSDAQALPALARLADRVRAPQDRPLRLTVVRAGVNSTVFLPGRILLISSTLIEDYEEPDVAAGFLIAELQRARMEDPLERLLHESGWMSSFRLLTTGTLPDKTLRAYAETLLTRPTQPVPLADLLEGFRAAGVRASPYAYALDVSGEQTLPLIEADPYPQAAPSPVLSDSDWVRLQGICGG
ncbi:hypothetical protein [Thalassovita taeanensis]|uniref:Peptidase M48 domain-containing protein n=1 Tax=Thalassovita taeanensis TaxID=657014 RepID=A0A1H9G9D5_9RHOB|nr:hypothetical protein [Thalassovita taeanensis]SEQ46755.1 hypothetical protein SAMN04488092_10792 [Thalassovita taeanensis]